MPTEETQSLQSRILGTSPVEWSTLQFIQQDTFKDLAPDARQKLKTSILSNQFTQPFYVWHDNESGVIFCLDGKHRVSILEELKSEGHDIPDMLPATFIDCKDKQTAAKLVLHYSSMYAKITETGLSGFMELYQLNPDEMSLTVDLPGIESFVTDIPEINSFDDEGIGVQNQYGVIVMCEDEKSQAEIFEALAAQGYKCKVVVT